MSSILNESHVKDALSLIENAGLPHPSGPLLSSFIIEALNPRLAADYVLQSCRPVQKQDVDLLAIVSDWAFIVDSISQHGCPPQVPDASTQAAITKRDGGKCCITGKAGRIWDPLIVVPILPIPSRWVEQSDHLFTMLGAFFTPQYRDWWLAYTEKPENMNPYHSHWLNCKSAANAFAQGFLKLDRLPPSLIEYKVNQISFGGLNQIDVNGHYPLLGDQSRLGLEKVDPRFIGTHARLSQSRQWLNIAKQISLSMETQPSLSMRHANNPIMDSYPATWMPSLITGLMKTVCLALWLMLPDGIRVAVYKMLRVVGNHFYGKPIAYEPVQRLPFGLYLKYMSNPDGSRNELNALKMVRRYTSIPVPRPLDLILIPTESSNNIHSHDAYLLMSRLPGLPLSRCQAMLSDKDGAELVVQMQEYLAQLRAIPKTVRPEFAISNTLGEACRDPRIDQANPVGPFVDEAAFSQVLRNPDEQSRRDHRIVFTHADLNSRNILIDRVTRIDGTKGWKVTGIVDWENSGYYPEYWDYTKSLFEGFRYTQRWRDFMHDIFKLFGDYSKEFEVEKRSWEEGDYI